MRYLVGGRQAAADRQTVRVLMLKDAVGAPDGITKTHYAAGQEYDLPTDLADCFFSTGDADPAEAHMQAANAAQDAPGAPQAAAGASGRGKTRRGAPGAKFGASAGV